MASPSTTSRSSLPMTPMPRTQRSSLGTVIPCVSTSRPRVNSSLSSIRHFLPCRPGAHTPSVSLPRRLLSTASTSVVWLRSLPSPSSSASSLSRYTPSLYGSRVDPFSNRKPSGCDTLCIVAAWLLGQGGSSLFLLASPSCILGDVTLFQPSVPCLVW